MIDIIFSPVNIALTILVMLLIVYWLLSMLGGLDFDLDFDVDIDVDAEVDIDPDFETGSAVEATSIEDTSNVEVNKEDVVGKHRKPLKGWQIFLIYFNFVGLPFMFTLTCFVFFWWILAIFITSWFHLYESSFGFLLMAACFVPALFITKYFTAPFKSFFRKLNKDGDEPVDFIGRQGISLSNVSGEKMGSAEVIIDGNPYAIYIKSDNGEPIKYHESFLIIREAPDKSYYYVEPYTNNY